MKHNYLLLFFLFAVGLFSGFSQKISSQKGLTTAIFNLQAGAIKVYLPDDIRPGDIISGRIIAEPIGKNAKQITNNLAELKKYSISFNNEKFAIATPNNPIQFAIQTDRYVSGRMELISDIKTIEGEVVDVRIQRGEKKTPLPECGIPTHALTNEPLNIPGKFDGDATNTNCSLDNKPLEILAESPRQCIVSFPADAKGTQNLSVQEKGGQACKKNVSAVNMDVSAGRLNLRKGERTYIDVKITGLQNLPDTAILTLNNITIPIVSMMPSNNIVIPLAPDSVGSGTFTKRFDIQSIVAGNFTVNVNLDLPDNSNPAYNYDMRDLKNESGFPGSYGYIGDLPCEPEGKTIKWRWHKTFICEIDGRKVLPCGHTKQGNDVYEKLKELLEELELDKATDIGEKMAKAFSTAKTFSYSIHVRRKWVDYDIEYKCVNGKWQPIGGVYVKHGTDDLDWHAVKHPTTECWLTFDSPAAEKEFEAALENALRAACK